LAAMPLQTKEATLVGQKQVGSQGAHWAAVQVLGLVMLHLLFFLVLFPRLPQFMTLLQMQGHKQLKRYRKQR